MKDLASYGSVGVVILVAILGIALVAPFPVLYAPENITYPRAGHINVEVLKENAFSSEATLSPVMQDLLDYSGPVVLSIRTDNFDEARQDLLEYTRRQGDLRHLIVNLDMNGTEIEDFLGSQERQSEILEDLANTTSAFNDLSSLDVKYREEGGTGGLVSISYQGESLRNRIHAIRERYMVESRTVTSIGAHYNLENSTYEDSLVELKGIVDKVDRVQGERDQEVASLTPYEQESLTLVLNPDSGRYRDVVQVFGSLSGISRAYKPVTITLDSRPITNLMTDGRGAFSTTYTLEVVPAGNHTLGAKSTNLTAIPRILTVEPVDSIINLTVQAVANSSRVTCSGYLLANRPMRYAPVEITWEGHEPFTATTDGSGFYRTVFQLPAGTHRLAARFENGSYPVNGSVSATYDVTSTGETIPSIRKSGEARWANGTLVNPGEPQENVGNPVAGTIAHILPVALVVLMATVAAFWYLRRGRRREDRPAPHAEGLPNPSLDLFLEVPPPVLPETLGALYLRSLRELGLSTAAHLVYSRLASSIGTHTGIRNPALLTAREMAGACTHQPYGKIFEAFVRCYERIRYAGQKSDRARRGFENSMEKTGAAVEGDSR